MHFYWKILSIFWVIDRFHPLPVTLVEHMLMNSITNPLTGCSQHPSCSWGLGHHSTMCWQYVHTISDTYIHSVSKFIICCNISITKDNANMWSALAFQVQYSGFLIFLMHFCVVYRDFLWPTSTKCGQNITSFYC